MIPGFRTHTEPLNSDELLIAQAMIPSLKKTIGKANAVTNSFMADAMKKWMEKQGKKPIRLHGARVRKIINYIRRTEIPTLCANDKGYYVVGTIDELLEYRESLTQRIGAQIEIRDCIDKYLKTVQKEIFN